PGAPRAEPATHLGLRPAPRRAARGAVLPVLGVLPGSGLPADAGDGGAAAAAGAGGAGAALHGEDAEVGRAADGGDGRAARAGAAGGAARGAGSAGALARGAGAVEPRVRPGAAAGGRGADRPGLPD